MAGEECLPQRAAELAESMLSGLDRRWRHVQGVARCALQLARLTPPENASHLIAAAWLHDLGYASAIAVTGLHSVDGARFLEDHGWPSRVVSLVAYHTGAEVEAEERGLLDELHAFDPPPPDLLDLLTAADVTTSPDGNPIEPELRVAEILLRYEPEDEVHRAVSTSAPALVAAVARVRALPPWQVTQPM
jgi:hypothetical protein